MKRPHQISIAGHLLSIRSDEGPAYLKALANYVEDNLDALAGQAKASPQPKLLLILAMQIADELFREKDLHRQFREQVARRINTLEAALAEHEAMLAQSPPPTAREIKQGLS